MATLFSSILLALVVLAAVPVLVFFVEVMAAINLPRPRFSNTHTIDGRPRVAVLIPAHNESIGILPTIKNVEAQLRAGDRLLVVADNCTDDTAIVATSLGAEVVERIDPARMGKGFALDWGIKHLIADPPEILIILDADCCFSDGSIDKLAVACHAEGRPTQALNLMKAPADLPESFQFAEFAWRVKNWVRPLGLQALHLPCHLTGTGMAFPWEIIQLADLASGEIVEDLKLGLELARAGYSPVFCRSARVVSYFPSSTEGAKTQRERWEQGHLNIIVGVAPWMIWAAIPSRNLDLFALALDAAVPPIVLLTLAEATLLLLSSAALAWGLSGTSFYIVVLSVSALAIAILLSWRNFGRDVLPFGKILTLPVLLMGKLNLYRRIMSRGRTNQWIRTDRAKTTLPKKRID
jgi:cellulose synthase/poly-beta-1,6-N-acetylglucosamine synthase-like glycosyltransferase